MLEIFKALLFGLVEGITEWLPVSSTGHMILLDEFVCLDVSDEFYEMFQVVIQLGAVLAVPICFFKRLCPLPVKSIEGRSAIILWSKVAVAVIPSAIVGLLLDELLDRYFYNAVTVSVTLVFYGIVFILLENIKKSKPPKLLRAEDISYTDALAIGLFQILALIPGTSRSGATVLGAILMGLSRSVAAEFSFFLAIPTMLGAGALKGAKYVYEGNIANGEETITLLVGFLTAFAVSCVTIRFLTDFVKKHSFAVFGVYRIALGITVAIYFLIF